MKIFVFVEIYPIPFKPYYDAQLADFIDAGHEVTVFSYRAHTSTMNEKVVQYRLHERTVPYPVTLRHAARVARSLGNLVRRPRLALRAMGAAWRAGTTPKSRVVHALRGLVVARGTPDLCLVHSASTAIWFRWLKRAFPETPVAVYYHGGEVPTVEPLADEVVALGFQGADVIFTNTEFSRQHAVSRGAPPERMRILPVGFDLKEFTAGAAPRDYRRGGTLRLLSAGRMSEEKGFIYALQALKKVVDQGMTDIHYALTGSGFSRPGLEEFVNNHHLQDHVTFLGTISTDALQAEMARADVLLLPSIQVGNWVENQACAVQEAMLWKTLVVTSRTGGVPECVAPELQPFVAPEKDVDALAAAIERIYRMDAGEMERLGERGRTFVEERFDLRRLNQTLLGTALASGRA